MTVWEGTSTRHWSHIFEEDISKNDITDVWHQESGSTYGVGERLSKV